MQIIRSLAEALAWFEKELAWGVEPGELRHLTGRIGELYAATITRGQMAPSVNQRGYDVVSARNERISVKTITTSSHVMFRKSTLHEADRVIVLKIDIDEGEVSIEEIVDSMVDDFILSCQELADSYRFGIRSRPTPSLPVERLLLTAEARSGPYRIVQYENGTIQVEADGIPQPVAKPILRQIASAAGIGLLNGSGNEKNTRQLGADIIASLKV